MFLRSLRVPYVFALKDVLKRFCLQMSCHEELAFRQRKKRENNNSQFTRRIVAYHLIERRNAVCSALAR